MKPMTIPEIQDIVRSRSGVGGGFCAWRRAGAGSKPALISQDGFSLVETSEISGLLEYEPQEFTFTALSGTPLAEIEQALAAHGQFLPSTRPCPGRRHVGGVCRLGAERTRTLPLRRLARLPAGGAFCRFSGSAGEQRR